MAGNDYFLHLASRGRGRTPQNPYLVLATNFGHASLMGQYLIRLVTSHSCLDFKTYKSHLPYQIIMSGASTAHGAGHDPAASAKALAANKAASWRYACALAGLVGVFIFTHFGRSFFHLQSRRGTLAKALAVPSRYELWSSTSLSSNLI